MPDWVTQVPLDFWSVLGEMAPYLLFGFLMAGVLSVVVSPELIERHLGSGGVLAVLKAAAFGVPLPLCSCGVIPVAASLRKHGAATGPTTAFLISTPQDGVDSILATYGLLGGVFAVFRPILALITGVIGGLAVNLVEPASRAHTSPPSGDVRGKFLDDTNGRIRRIFAYGFYWLPRDIARALLVGLLIAGVISAAVPRNYFADLVPPGILQILIVMLLGIPVYVCATASIPLAYAMILSGVSPGAVLAFLMTGPATNAATIATVWKVMGRRTTAIYLASMIAGALIGGLILDRFLTSEDIVGRTAVGWMIPPAVKHVSAVILLLVLSVAVAYPLAERFSRRKEAPPGAMVLKIHGMTCTGCAASVRRALLECPGVESAQVDLSGGTAVVQGKDADFEVLAGAVRAIGHRAERVSEEQRT